MPRTPENPIKITCREGEPLFFKKETVNMNPDYLQQILRAAQAHCAVYCRFGECRANSDRKGHEDARDKIKEDALNARI